MYAKTNDKFHMGRKKARIPSQMQGKHKEVGGLGVHIPEDYFAAAILDQLRNWFDQKDIKHWCQLEQTWIHPRSLQSLILAHSIQQIKTQIDHPTIQASLQAWSNLKKTSSPKANHTKIPITLEALQWLIPNFSLTQWQNRNIFFFGGHIMMQSEVMSFKEIQKRFKLHPSEFLTYLQITSWYKKWNTSNFPILTQAWKHLNSANPKAKGISQMYELLSDKKSFIEFKPMHKWELDRGQKFTVKQ